MASVSTQTVQQIAHIPTKDSYIEEAEFGLKHVEPFLSGLTSCAHVLEVGAGPCILISELCKLHPNFNFRAIEPLGSGFDFFESFIEKLKSEHLFDLYRGGYEDFQSDHQFDLIYLVNVFEHLPDYRDFLGFVKDNLTDGGRCVILCPNYGFPYEPHFKLPILISPAITQKLFSRYIKTFEAENDTRGLWSSLNFVKLKDVRQTCREIGLHVKFNTQITEEMIRRLDEDSEFAKRQGVLSLAAKFLKKTGLLGLFNTKALFNFQPYMFLELTRFRTTHV